MVVEYVDVCVCVTGLVRGSNDLLTNSSGSFSFSSFSSQKKETVTHNCFFLLLLHTTLFSILFYYLIYLIPPFSPYVRVILVYVLALRGKREEREEGEWGGVGELKKSEVWFSLLLLGCLVLVWSVAVVLFPCLPSYHSLVIFDALAFLPLLCSNCLVCVCCECECVCDRVPTT